MVDGRWMLSCIGGGLATWQRGDRGVEAHSLILVGGTRQGRGCVCIQATPLGRQLMPTQRWRTRLAGTSESKPLNPPSPSSVSALKRRLLASRALHGRLLGCQFGMWCNNDWLFFGLVSPQAYHAGFRHGTAAALHMTQPPPARAGLLGFGSDPLTARGSSAAFCGRWQVGVGWRPP